MCPQKTSQCGNTKDFTPAAPGDTSTVEVSGLFAGESCTYNVKSQCGAPGFKVKSESTATASQIDISYMEIPEKSGTTDTSTRSTSTGMRKRMSAKSGMPARDTSVMTDGVQPADSEDQVTGGSYNMGEKGERTFGSA